MRHRRALAVTSQVRFELQNSHGLIIKHVVWCVVADLGYELLLGRKFCHDNGFTRFNELSTEWQNVSAPDTNASVSAVSSAASVTVSRQPRVSKSNPAAAAAISKQPANSIYQRSDMSQ
jgi:hypothetical protein